MEINKWIILKFFYGGSMIDIFLNYSLLLCFTIMILYSTLVPLERWKKSLQSLLFVAIQAIIWFSTPAYGVSIIWCGQLGLILYYLILQRRRRWARLIYFTAVIFGTYVVYYYYVKFPLITTQVHLFSVVLGAFVTALLNCF